MADGELDAKDFLFSFSKNAASPWYATMVLAWSVTEVIRYAHYVATLLNVKAPLLEWLR